MSTPRDEIARRVAARLAPQIGLTLPAYVERTLAGVADNDDEAVQRMPDPGQIAIVKAVVEETIVEGKRLAGKPGSE